MKGFGFLFPVGWVAVALAAAGCEKLPSNPPESLSQLRRQRTFREQAFTRETIVLHNLRRVLSDDLPVADRIESMRVVSELDAPGVEACPALAQALTKPDVPQPLRKEVVGFLAQKRYAGLGPYMAEALRQTKDPRQREAIFKWIQEHPSPDILIEIVKLWAAEPPLRAEEELRFRQIVQRITGKKWDQALLDGLNSKEFFARGSAIEVLAARPLPNATLKQRILALRPQAQAVRAMQVFAEKFGYLPKTRRQLLAVVTIYRQRERELTRVARLVNRWRTGHRYRFNIRDFHLLHALASDPLRNVTLSRTQLTLEVSRAIASRRTTPAPRFGVIRSRRATVFRRRRLVDFDGQVESLSMADLWNLYLLNQMFSRPRVRRMLQVTAQRDRADRQTQWGGLIVYESGQAEARLYWPAAKRGDQDYVPSRRMLIGSIDAMAYFVGHFDKLEADPAWAGPNDRELRFAKKNDLCGVVITSVGRGRFNVACYNTSGIVVDLGDYRTPPR